MEYGRISLNSETITVEKGNLFRVKSYSQTRNLLKTLYSGEASTNQACLLAATTFIFQIKCSRETIQLRSVIQFKCFKHRNRITGRENFISRQEEKKN